MKLRLPKKRRHRIYIYIASTLLVLLAIDQVWVHIWRHITLGYDTTRITAPLKPNGMPDYVRFLNEQNSQGVTRENNAAIPLLLANGPSYVTDDPTSKILAALGAPPPPANGKYSQSYQPFLEEKSPKDSLSQDAVDKEVTLLYTHPWDPAQHADAVEWLRAETPYLVLFRDAANRTRYYTPLITTGPDDLAISCLLPGLGGYRNLCNIAISQAMLDLHERRFAAAADNILDCHRVAGLLAQGPTLIESLVAVAIDRQASAADRILAASNPPPELLRAHLAALDALTPFPTFNHCLDAERFTVLDCLAFASRDPARALRIITGDDSTTSMEDSLWTATPLPARLIPAHFNAALRDANEYYDRAIQIAQAPAHLRSGLNDTWQREFEQYSNRYSRPLADPAKQFFSRLAPSLGRALQIADERAMEAQLTRLAFALALYHAENTDYPDTLSPLSPKYLLAIPPDIFIDAPLHYQKTPDGYRLYSVGANQHDDGGHTRGDPIPHSHTGPNPDDLVVKTPQ